MVVTLSQQLITGEKPSVMLYAYINRHAGTPDKKQNLFSSMALLSYIITTLFDDALHCFVLFLVFVWCPCMAINASVQYNNGLLLDIILLTQFYYHKGTRLNALKRFCLRSL